MQQVLFSPIELSAILSGLREVIREELHAQQTADLAEKLLTPDETAELLRVSKVTLWQWEREGRLKKYSIGGKTFYKYSELLGSLESLQRYNKPAIRRAAK